MKARLLQKYLNTERAVHDTGKHIAVASGMVSELLTVDKKTFHLKYCMDTFNEGRSSLRSEELQGVWDGLKRLIDSGEINDYIDGQDKLDNPLPVYTVEGGELIETSTDKYGWPNVTIDGVLMHDNVYFETKEEAISEGIEDCEDYIKMYNGNIDELKEKIISAHKSLRKKELCLHNLKNTPI